MARHARREGHQGTKARGLRHPRESQEHALTATPPPDGPSVRSQPSKDKLGRCEVPNGTDTDRYHRLLSERRKSGAKGHHLGAKPVERRANGRLLPPGSTPEAGGGVAGPMQPDPTAHSGRR